MVRFCYKYIIFLILLSFTFDISAQYDESEVKAALLFNLGSYVGGEHLKQADSLQIGLYTNDTSFISQLKKFSYNKKMRNKPVAIKKLSGIEKIEHLHILYIDKKYNKQVPAIYDSVKGKNILLVTNGIEDKTHTMINFYKKAGEGTLAFEVSKNNIDVEGFDYSNELLVYGTTLSDLREIYSETYKQLMKERKRLNEYERTSKNLKTNIEKYQDTNKQLNKSIDSLKEKVKTKENRLQSLSELIEAKEKNILKKKQQIIDQRTIQKSLKTLIDTQRGFIENAKNKLNTLNTEIDEKEKKIIEQDQLLSQKERSLTTQKKLIFISVALLIALLIAILSVLHNYAIKKRMNIKLEDDVAERTKKLKESELKFRSLAESSPDNIVRYDENEKIQYVNDQFLNLVGLEKDDITGKDQPEKEFPVLKQIIDKNNVKKSFETGYIISRQQDVTINDNTLTLDWKFVPEKNETGKIVSILAVSRDISNLKRIHDELHEAKKQAEESDKLKSAFLANLSHEIRTPLNAILGFSNIVSDKNITDEERINYTNIIQSKGYYLLELINDIIDISIIESGKLKIFKRSFNLNTLMDELHIFFYEMLKKRGKEKDIKLTTKKQKKATCIINTDKNRLQQILTNLLSNAVKFTEKGKIETGYTIEADAITFYVLDTGVGIPEENHKTIFKRFNKGTEDKNKLYEGTGLGLSIVEKLIELLDGKLWFTSKEGEGTIFYFTIPYKNIEDKYTISPPHTNKEIPFPDLTGKTVMIVDDDQSNLIYLEELMKKTNAIIIKAYDGDECIKRFKKNPETRLILLDLKMPKMNGYEVINEIKEINQDVQIIAQTAYAMNGDRDIIINSGFDEYLSKPISQEQLIKVLNKITF